MICFVDAASISPIKDQSVTEGQSLQLLCMADGNPTPTIWWQKEDNTFSQRSSVLGIQNINRRDRGVYTCHAQNTVRVNDLSTEHILVSESANIDVFCKFTS